MVQIESTEDEVHRQAYKARGAVEDFRQLVRFVVDQIINFSAVVLFVWWACDFELFLKDQRFHGFSHEVTFLVQMHAVVLIHNHAETNLDNKEKSSELNAVLFITIFYNISDKSLKNKWLDDSSECTNEWSNHVDEHVVLECL